MAKTAPTSQRAVMTPQQLSEYLSVPLQTLANWRYRGIGPPWTKVERHVRYRTPDVERWLDAQTRGGDAA